MYLVVDKDKRTTLWDKQPVYFSDEGRWYRRFGAMMDSAVFPPLEKIAADLGITPGKEGILAVNFILRPINEVLHDGEVREEADGGPTQKT